MIAAVLLLVLLLHVHDDVAHAADVHVGQVVHFDATYSACSAIVGFEALHASNNGVLFLGDGAATPSSAGYSNGKPAIVAATEPTHTHTGAGLTSTIDDEALGDNYLFGSYDLMLGMGSGTVPTGANAGITDAKGSNLPFVQVLACRVAAAGGMELPAGGILSMDPGSSTSTAINACPSTGYAEFTQGAGRFMVAASAPLQAAPYAAPNPPSALSPSTYATFGDHQHSFTSTVTLKGHLALGYFLPTKSYADEGDFAVTGSLTKSNINLPFKVAKQCQATTDLSSPVARQLPYGALVFFATPTCPPLWSQAPADANVNGRLIVTMNGGSNGQTFGSASNTLLATSHGAGHAHALLTGARMQFTNSIKLGTSLDPTGILFDNTGFEVKSAPSGETAIGVPTVHVLLCRFEDPSTLGATPPPTATTTAAPSSVAPTSAPTATASPTTVAPTTASPTSAAPTTASPTSAAPISASPTTAAPTTASPTSLRPTTLRPSRAPTTHAPSVSPSSSPTVYVEHPTPRPSSPSAAPTANILDPDVASSVKEGDATATIVASVIGVLVGLLSVIILLLVCCNKKHRIPAAAGKTWKSDNSDDGDDSKPAAIAPLPAITNPRFFPWRRDHHHRHPNPAATDTSDVIGSRMNIMNSAWSAA